MNHGFLIGRGGSAINKMKDQLGVRFSFASPKDADPELITIIGRKEDVEKAKKELEAKIAGLVSLKMGDLKIEVLFVTRRRRMKLDYKSQAIAKPTLITYHLPTFIFAGERH